MAYHHDPRYGQPPYGYQPQFPHSQPNLQQHNYGGGRPVGPAPPQAYIQNRSGMFPPQMQQQTANGMIQSMNPGYPGQFHNSNASGFQHNAQFDSTYQDPNQASHNFHSQASPFQGQFYQNQFQGVAGQIPPTPRSMIIPPPPQSVPPPPSQLFNSHIGGTWPSGNGLPPKPQSLGYQEGQPLPGGYENDHLSKFNYNTGSDKSKEISGFVGTGEAANAGAPGVEAPLSQLTHASPARASFDADARHSTLAKASGNMGTKRAQGTSNAAAHDGHSSRNNLISLQTDLQKQYAPQANDITSPDIYSPQSNADALPGLGSGNDDSHTHEARVMEVPTEMIRHRTGASRNEESKTTKVQPPAGAARLKPAQTGGQVSAPSPMNPFVLKQSALAALKDLHAQEIAFKDITSEGVDSRVLRGLFVELGIATEPVKQKQPQEPIQSNKPKSPLTSKVTTQSQRSEAPQNAQPQAKAKENLSPRNVSVAAVSAAAPTSKPPTREEYLARLKAAKGEKASTSAESHQTSNGNTDSPALSDKEFVALPSDTAAGDSLPKKPDAKSLSVTDRVRQRLEALKKSTREKQANQAQEAAKAPHNIDAISMEKSALERDIAANGEYTPANPFFSPDKDSMGIPGLSMSDEPELSRIDDAFQDQSRQSGVLASTLAQQSSLMDKEHIQNPLKRARTPSFPDKSEALLSKRLEPDDRQEVIELSDDEEEGEVTDTRVRPGLERNLSTGSFTAETMVRPSSQSQPFRSDDLAAKQEEIRLYRQRIAALEAKKKARIAVASLNVSPVSNMALAQSKPISSMSNVQALSLKSSLTAVGDQVQAQQENLVAAKSMVEERLEREEQAYRTSVAESTKAEGSMAATGVDRQKRQQRIATLRDSLNTLNTKISQAEAELAKLRQQEEEIQRELERGLQGRESFAKELKDLVDAMTAEDEQSAAVIADRTGQMPFESNGHRNDARKEVSDRGDDEREVEANALQADIEADRDSTDNEDTTMDISDAEEGEISDSENEQSSANRASASQQSTQDDYEPTLQDKKEDVNEAPTPQLDHPNEDDDDDSSMDVEQNEEQDGEVEEFEHQSDKASSPGAEEMDYEPDYEPEAEPEMEVATIRSDSSEAREYEPPREIADSPKSPGTDASEENSNDGLSADLEAAFASESASERDEDEMPSQRRASDSAAFESGEGEEGEISEGDEDDEAEEEGAEAGQEGEEEEEEIDDDDDDDDDSRHVVSVSATAVHPNQAGADAAEEIPGLTANEDDEAGSESDDEADGVSDDELHEQVFGDV